MNYYVIRQSPDPRTIGVKKGASQAEIDRSGFANPSHYDNILIFFFSKYPSVNWANVGRIPEFEIKLDRVRLDDKAKLTDFVSYYPNLRHGGNFLWSPRALELVRSYNLPPFRIYDANLHHQGKARSDYKLLFCPPLPYSVIDFKKTNFFTGDELLGKEFFKLGSGEDFEQKKREGIFGVQEIFFNELFDKNLDYFLTRISIPLVFISERLKVAFEKAGLTGVNVVNAKEPTIRF